MSERNYQLITKKKLIGLVLVKLKYTVETSVPLTKKFKWMYVYFWPSADYLITNVST